MNYQPHPEHKNMFIEAGQGLENYGKNLRKNLNQGQADLRSGKSPTYGAINPFPNPLKSSSYKNPR